MNFPSRRAYLEKLSEILNEEIVVCCMADTTEHWAEFKGKDSNFYVSDSMGMVIPTALGIALSRPKDRVVALEGDGGVLMNMGCLVTSAITAPKNFLVVVFNNDIYEASGGQPLAQAGLHYEDMARASGFAVTTTVDNLETFGEKVQEFLAQEELSFLCAVTNQDREKAKTPFDLRPVEIKLQFERWCREHPG
jgi:thiamine pyrophosphate-dependent acetolactate synthase large subunit-like protein